jgi:hypothetical protein
VPMGWRHRSPKRFARNKVESRWTGFMAAIGVSFLPAIAMNSSVIQGCFPNGFRQPAPRLAPMPPPVAQRATMPRGAAFPPPRTVAPRQQPQQPVVQRFGAGTAMRLPDGMATAANRSIGQPLQPAVRQMMESLFHTSFDDVRVHVGPHVAAIGATSYTQGSNIHFAPGQYTPENGPGRQRLAYELAHVVQQRAGRVHNPFGSGVAIVYDAHLEAEAARVGAALAPARGTAQRKVQSRRPEVQRSRQVGGRHPIQRMIGLAELFGQDEWNAGGTRAPAGAVAATLATRTAFANLRAAGQIDAAALVGEVPVGCANTFEIEPRSQRGFKYQWNDTNGTAWTVWGHEADAGAALGHVGGAGWTVRIRNGNHFLMAATINPPVGVPYDWATATTPIRIAASHIPLTNV